MAEDTPENIGPQPNIKYFIDSFRASTGDPSKQESYISLQRALGNTEFTDWVDKVKQGGWDELTHYEQQLFLNQFKLVRGHNRASKQQESLAKEFLRDPRKKFNEEMEGLNPYADDWGLVDEYGRPRYRTVEEAIRSMYKEK